MNEQTKGELIEQKINRDTAGAIVAGSEFGGLRIQNMLEVMEMAKLMAVSQQAVPAHLRNNPGMCLAVCLTALEWKMSPFAVASKTYVTSDRLNYESQLVHAVIEARAPLKERLRCRYEGEGEERVCIVYGTFKGEREVREHRSRTLAEARPRKNSDGIVKGSPLWQKKPDVQMWYDTSRDWVRIHCPDILLGVYTPDEVEQYGIGEDARDVTDTAASAALHERLKAAPVTGEGFHDDAVTNGLAEVAGEPEAKGRKGKGAAKKRTTGHGKPVVEGITVTPGNAGEVQITGNKLVSAEEFGAKPDKPVEHDSAKGVTTIGNVTVAKVEPGDTPSVPAIKVVDPRTYELHFDGWLAVLTTEADIRARWATERKLRNNCGITAEERKPMEARLEARILEPDVERIP